MHTTIIFITSLYIYLYSFNNKKYCFRKNTVKTHSAAAGKLIPINAREKTCVYISIPVPRR